MIEYSRGTSTFDAHPEQRSAPDFGAFCDAILSDRASAKGQQYVCAAMSDGHRCKASSQPRRWIGLDMDGCDPARFAALLIALESLSALLYLTASSTPECLRARIVVELAMAVDRPSARETSKRVRDSLGADLDWDDSCDRAEQPLFLPLHGAQHWRFPGESVVPSFVLPAPVIPAAVAVSGPAHPFACRVAEHDLACGAADLRNADAGGRNNLLAAIAYRMGQYVGAGALARDAVTRMLLDAASAWGELGKSLATVERQVSEGARKPITLPLPPVSPTAIPGPSPRLARNAADLMRRTFTPVQWAIRDVVPEGVTILSGAPKSGKSFLVLQWAFAIATGCAVWEGRVPETRGRVLYLALEDKDQRMQKRLAGVRLDRGASDADMSLFDYDLEWPTAEQGVERIREYLLSRRDCRLVIVDTISTFRNNDPGRKSAYAHDYEVGKMFKPLCREFNVAIVLVAHTRKLASDDPMQQVSGTQGLTGSVDNVLVLEKAKRGANHAVLHVDGRDIENPTELAITRNGTGFWTCLGTAEEVSRSDETRDVLDALTTIGGIGSAREIQSVLAADVKIGTLRMRLTRMVKRGEIYRNMMDQYSLVSTTVELPSPPPLELPKPGRSDTHTR